MPPDLNSLRVDQIGSLLRPAKLKEIFAKFVRGEASDEELRRAQDEAIRDVVAKQEAHNLPHQPAKVTLIGPDRITQCYDSESSRSVYPTVDEFLSDVVSVERKMIAQLADGGCQYIGIDGPGYTAYVDGASIDAMRSRGEDSRANMERSIKADNEVIANFPGVTFGIPICRCNRQDLWHGGGRYDAIAED